MTIKQKHLYSNYDFRYETDEGSASAPKIIEEAAKGKHQPESKTEQQQEGVIALR
ncbi:hypothetical protein [Sunxiuqinia indica]|uniref:hypothetical protein n=1 Tax=Sunxiuqinia indica TaxID=2692584 RepID=UPI001356C3BF|nr:hypothetical protein [Sunxiuqinia indica]